MRPKLPKLAAIMDEAEDDVLAYMTFQKAHWTKLHSTNGIERLNGEIKQRTDVVGIFPNGQLARWPEASRPRSSASSAPCSWNRTTNGRSSAAAT
jgi:transposase-like protein